ncbi:transglycosylase SLT domain-containing protein [Desulfohalovibrio reitneri]|uniref:transglycosylase SLT domain-containing protein n=1 Tax=Desulfohalovibrio reitneri TaxID=1307759 RepID=UPI00068EF79C|nr:transglycosylase SLT domain-containing protein [Desulfohalovibrio reitneri]
MPFTHTRVHHTWLAVALLAAIQLGLLFLVPEPDRRAGPPGTLVVAAAPSELVRSTLGPYGPGFETELVQAFCETAGLKPRWRHINHWSEGWRLLASGEADVLIGPGLTPPEWVREEVRSGPNYLPSEVVLLHNNRKFPLSDPARLCRVPLLLQEIPALPGLLEEYTRTEADCAPQGEVLTTGPELRPLLEMMRGHAARFAAADDRQYRLWQPVVDEVRPTRRTGKRIFRNWHWRAADKRLEKRLPGFWEERGKELAADLAVRYLSFLPREFDYYEQWHLRQMVRSKLPLYRETILEAARANNLDPLFLTAVIYQESRFDVHAKSYTGVRGLMMLSLATAETLGVADRTDPGQSIRGGARYLRHLHDRIDRQGLSPWNRWFVTLAAYNQGLEHARDAIDLAGRRGTDTSRWRNVKKAFRLLTRRRYYSQADHGYTRGHEAAEYVANIRLFYYTLRGLAVVPGNEAEHLAPLLAAVPAGWPG